MKRVLLITSLLLTIVLNLNAQCWTQPGCTNEVQVSGNISNQNYNGNTCFDGAGYIMPNVNFNNWNFLSFSGSLVVNQTVNMNNRSNIYANGSIEFKHLNFFGGDTLFANGAIILDKVNSNNSTKEHPNVIIISETSSLLVSGQQYVANTVIKQNNGTGNEIYVKSCSQITLPVKLSEFYMSGSTVWWKMETQDNVGSYMLKGTYDGKIWQDIAMIFPNQSGIYNYDMSDTSTTKKAGLGILVLAIIIGISVSKRKFKVAGISLMLMVATISSCNKKDMIKPTEPFNGYQIAINMQDGSTINSQVIWINKKK